MPCLIAVSQRLTKLFKEQSMNIDLKQIAISTLTQEQKQSIDAESVRQMRFAKNEYGERKMSADPAYRAKVEAMEKELIANR